MNPVTNPSAQHSTLGEATEEKIVQGGPVGNGEFTYVDISSVDNQTKRIVEPKRIAAESAPSRAKQRLKAGDVLVSMTRPNLNAVAIVPDQLSDAIGSTGFHVLRARQCDPRWLFYAVQSTGFVDAMSQLVQGALYPAVRPKDIRAFSIPLPRFEIQQEIIEGIETQLSRLEAGLSALKRAQANLKRYRAAVLKAACEGRLVPTEADLARAENRNYESGEQLQSRLLVQRKASFAQRGRYQEPAEAKDASPVEMPTGWTWMSADECTRQITDGEHITPQRTSTGILLLSARNVQDGRLSLSDVDYVPDEEYDRIAKRLVIEENDVLLSCSGSVGRSTVAPAGLKFTLVRSVAVLKPLANMGKYISIALRSPQVQGQIKQAQTQTAQANIFQGKIKVLGLPIPPLAEQERIVAEVERRLSIVDQLEATIDDNLKRATRLRQSILQRAFSGSG